jgi:hypothetical protein
VGQLTGIEGGLAPGDFDFDFDFGDTKKLSFQGRITMCWEIFFMVAGLSLCQASLPLREYNQPVQTSAV